MPLIQNHKYQTMHAPRLFLEPAPSVHEEDGNWYGSTYEGIQWQMYTGDSAQVLRAMPDNNFDCVITSPPYYWLRDYGVDGQIGKEETVGEYVTALATTMDEIYRVLKQEGVLFLNLGDTYYSGKGESQGKDDKSKKRRFGLRAVDKSGGLGIGIQRKSTIGIPWRVAIEMCARNWVLRCPIVWHRKHALPENVKDRPRRSYEFLFMFVKSRKYYFNREPLVAKNIDEDVWTIVPRAKQANGIDTAPFPDELVQRCLDIGCPPGGRVLDPFAGSGTTLRVALNSGRPAAGIELNREFCSHAVNNLRNL